MHLELTPQYQITQEPALLSQYFALRQTQYHRHFPSLPPSFGLLEADDLTSDILVATLGSSVIGGARLSYVVPADPTRRLPLESPAFSLRETFPSWALETMTICEFGRHAVHPDYGSLISRPLATEMALAAARHGATLAFTVCPPAQIVLNRRHCRSLGLEFEVFPDINPANPFGLSMALCVYRKLPSLLQTANPKLEHFPPHFALPKA